MFKPNHIIFSVRSLRDYLTINLRTIIGVQSFRHVSSLQLLHTLYLTTIGILLLPLISRLYSSYRLAFKIIEMQFINHRLRLQKQINMSSADYKISLYSLDTELYTPLYFCLI